MTEITHRIVVTVELDYYEVEPLMDVMEDAYWEKPAWLRWLYDPSLGGVTPRSGTSRVDVTSDPWMPQFVARWLVSRVMKREQVEGYVSSRREVWVTHD